MSQLVRFFPFGPILSRFVPFYILQAHSVEQFAVYPVPQ